MYIYDKILVSILVFKLQFCKDIQNFQLLTDNLELIFFFIFVIILLNR